MTARALIVPMRVDALCVNAHTDPTKQPFLGASADFSALPKWDASTRQMLGGRYTSASLQSFAEWSPEIGIHLHWALPAVFTHGTQQGDSVVFPPVPTRWLVTRLHTNSDDPNAPVTQRTSWIVESDFLAADATGPSCTSVPFVNAEGDQYFRWLGRVVDYDTWQGSPPAASFKAQTGHALSAVGYGDTMFAAFYPNCRGVFAFHDDLKTLTGWDRTSSKITYVVSGWFGDPADDPFASPAMAPSSWTIVDDGGGAFTSTLVTGTVQGIAWDPDTDYFAAPRAPVIVAIGNTNAEALSALVARRTQQPNVEAILDAVQLGVFAETPDADAVARLEQAQHTQAFGSSPGGTTWVVTPPPQVAKSAADRDAALIEVAGAQQVSLPDALAAELDRLNTAQRAYDRAVAEIVSAQEQLFHDWYRYIEARHDPNIAEVVPALADPSAYDTFITALRAFVQTEASQTLPQKIAACGVALFEDQGATTTSAPTSLAGQLVAQLQKVTALLEPGGFVLQRTPAPRYWHPKDPVVVVAGADLSPPPGDDGATLLCRVASQISATLTWTRPAGKVTLDGADLLATFAFDKTPFPSELQSLVAEACLLEPTQRDAIADALAHAAGGDHEGAVAGVTALQSAAVLGQTVAGAFALSGTAPNPLALARWSATPWLPLYLRWSVDYVPHTFVGAAPDAAFPADLLTANFAFDATGIERTSATGVATQVQGYSGTIALAPHALLRLKTQIADLLARQSDPTLAGLAANLDDVPVLSQALSGFHQALTMRSQTLQLGVVDPLADAEVDFDTAVQQAVGVRNESAPRPLDAFNPIRAGFTKIRALSLVDAFGQVRDVDVSPANIAVAGALAPVDPAAKANGYAQLPPRFSQPARLSFRWLSASDDQVESNAHPATSPVCGWLLPNYFDDSLAIYDAQGQALGELALIAGGTDVRFRATPKDGQPIAPDATKDAQTTAIRAAIAQPHLQRFVLGVFARGAAFLDGILRAVDRALLTIIPPSRGDASVAALTGRPLALVRASLALDLLGLPAAHLGWPTLQNEVSGPTPASRDTRGFTRVNVDVQLGDAARADDGLVGYFIERTGTEDDYGAFYTPAPADGAGANGVLPSTANPVLLDADASSAAQIVTLLMDPHAEVHATSGVLPVKTLALPPDQYTDALSRLEIFFLCSPILASSPRRVPLPDIHGFAWSWAHPSAALWSETTDLALPTDRATPNDSPIAIEEGWLKLARRAAAPE